MKTIASIIFVLSLVGLTAPCANASSGPSASGTYRFVLDDDLSKSVEFSATADERGVTTGQMTFRDEAILEQQDVDGTGGESEDPKVAFFMTANLNSMKIENNRAVLGGTVTDSSNPSYIGKWVQLVVEDGDGLETSDKFGWCFCQPEAGGWVPVDAEVKEDEGAWYKWWATDAELKDDAGVQSENIIPGNKTSCEVLALSAYEFAEVKSGEGQIQIQP